MQTYVNGNFYYNDRGIKPCPSCGALVEKFNGCNQMFCSVCKYKWCWMCGAKCDSKNENNVPHYINNATCQHSFDSDFENFKNQSDGSYCGIMNKNYKIYRTVAEIMATACKTFDKTNFLEDNNCCDECVKIFDVL